MNCQRAIKTHHQKVEVGKNVEYSPNRHVKPEAQPANPPKSVHAYTPKAGIIRSRKWRINCGDRINKLLNRWINMLGSKTLGLKVLELLFVMLANTDQNV